jgi:hypothetical protein
MVQIVEVSVSLVQAPTPSLLQQTGAFISQGGTNATTGSLTLITSMADLAAMQPASLHKAVSTLTWATGTVTATAAAPHGITNGTTFPVTIAGASPSGYNGTFTATITGASTFTYPLVVNPGTMTVPGTYTMVSMAEVLAMATTYFAQGSMQSVYILELGPGGPVDGVASLTNWLVNNPATVYSFLVPRAWDGVASFLTLIASYESPTALTYFWVTTTTATYTNYTSVMKCVISMVEAPSRPATEFSLAAAFYQSLAYRPGPINRMGPLNFKFLFGVTDYPTIGNGALLQSLKDGHCNWVASGAEGGITNRMIVYGTAEDGRDFSYWYSVDYTQINGHIVLANEVINGSNNRVNPLSYDQHGINRLQARLTQLMSNEVSFNLAVGTVTATQLNINDFVQALDENQFTAQAVVNAVPFVDYASANPSDFKDGIYRGLTIVYIPQRGFTQIGLALIVSDFLTF